MTKVYAPIGEVTQINPDYRQNIPTYPDYGTEFAGYSKKLISDGVYRLSNQSSYDRQMNFNWTASAAILTISKVETKLPFIKYISYSAYTDVDCYFSFGIYDDVSAIGYSLVSFSCKANTTVSGEFTLACPVQMDKVSFACKPNVAITGRVSIALSGWREDKLTS